MSYDNQPLHRITHLPPDRSKHAKHRCDQVKALLQWGRHSCAPVNVSPDSFHDDSVRIMAALSTGSSRHQRRHGVGPARACHPGATARASCCLARSQVDKTVVRIHCMRHMCSHCVGTIMHVYSRHAGFATSSWTSPASTSQALPILYPEPCSLPPV